MSPPHGAAAPGSTASLRTANQQRVLDVLRVGPDDGGAADAFTQAELARAMVDRDMLTSYADAKDQRVIQADRRITAIQDRIEAERAAVTDGGAIGSRGGGDGAWPGVHWGCAA